MFSFFSKSKRPVFSYRISHDQPKCPQLGMLWRGPAWSPWGSSSDCASIPCSLPGLPVEQLAHLLMYWRLKPSKPFDGFRCMRASCGFIAGAQLFIAFFKVVWLWLWAHAYCRLGWVHLSLVPLWRLVAFHSIFKGWRRHHLDLILHALPCLTWCFLLSCALFYDVHVFEILVLPTGYALCGVRSKATEMLACSSLLGMLQ